MKNWMARLVTETEGQDLMEYALLASLLSIVSVVTLMVLGPAIAQVWPRFEAIFSSV